jgi:hypothetical protein
LLRVGFVAILNFWICWHQNGSRVARVFVGWRETVARSCCAGGGNGQAGGGEGENTTNTTNTNTTNTTKIKIKILNTG